MTIFAIFSHNYKNEQKFLWSYYTEPHQICARCSHIPCTSKLLIGILIVQSVYEWQLDNEDFSEKISALWSQCMPGRGEGLSHTMLATARPSCLWFPYRFCYLYSVLSDEETILLCRSSIIARFFVLVFCQHISMKEAVKCRERFCVKLCWLSEILTVACSLLTSADTIFGAFLFAVMNDVN